MPAFSKTPLLIPKASALATGLVSAVFLGIWIFFPGWKEFSSASMKANTSLAVMLSSMGLWLLAAWQPGSKLPSLIAQALGVFVALLAGTTLCEYLIGIDVGIDELIVVDFPSAESLLFPGRMSPIAAFTLLHLGCAIFFLGRPGRIRDQLAATFTLPVIAVTFFALLGYIFGQAAFYKIGPYVRISWQTSASCLLLAVGILFLRPQATFVRLLVSESLGGATARRLLPVAVGVPVFLGWLMHLAVNAGYFDFLLASTLLVLSLIIVFATVVVITGHQLAAIDRERTDVFVRERAALEGLAKALSARDEFLSIASHELKTPLTSLRLQADVFSRRCAASKEATIPRAQVAQLLDRTNRQAERLTRLVDDMLDISRIQSGKLALNPERFNLCDLVRDVVDRMAPQFEDKGFPPVRLELCEDAFGIWDSFRLEQVLNNLLSNALRYGESRQVHVSVDAHGSQVRHQVWDQGKGLAPEAIGRIFERYERAVEKSDVSGLGLGLYISRRIVEAHGGRIHVESEPGMGACFTVDLPASAPHEREAGAVSAQSSP